MAALVSAEDLELLGPFIPLAATLGPRSRTIVRCGVDVTIQGRGVFLDGVASGLGARELVPDPSVRPVRGQLVVVENPGVTTWLTSVAPRAIAIDRWPASSSRSPCSRLWISVLARKTTNTRITAPRTARP